MRTRKRRRPATRLEPSNCLRNDRLANDHLMDTTRAALTDATAAPPKRPTGAMPRSVFVRVPHGEATRMRRTGTGPVPLAALVLLTALASANALSAGPYRLLGDVSSGGGGHSQNARYAVEGTAGQPTTQSSETAGRRFTVEAGFWTFAPAVPDALFADGFEP